MKTFKINYNGKDEDVEFDDNPRAGVMMKIRKNALRYRGGQAIPEVDIDEYAVGLACNLITKAPWGRTDPSAIQNLPDATYKKLCESLGDEFPLANDFLSLGRLMFGKNLDGLGLQLKTDSTTNAPSLDSPSDR